MSADDEHVLDHVDAYVHEALRPWEAKSVERHCAECRICQVALEEARKRLKVLQSVPPVEASEDLIRAAQERILQYRPPVVTLPRIALAAAACVAFVLSAATVYYATLKPTPYDLRILGQNQWIAGSEVSLRVLLVDQERKRPMDGVPVDIDLADARTARVVRLAHFTTDQWGSSAPRLRLPDWDAGDYELRVRAYPGRTEESIVRSVKLKRSWRVMLTSDKPVYQPGQTILLRGLALAQPDLKPVSGREAVFSITDPKGNVIFRRREPTSRFGIVSAECPLAQEILEGAYQVRCQVGDTESSLTVEVKKYVLPKFKVELSVDRAYYEPGQKVRGTVSARYFFGKPVADAQVKIEALTPDVGSSVVFSTTLKTDGSGSARFEFNVPSTLVGRPQDSGDARITLSATVRDSGSQQQAASLSRTVTAQPIRVEVIPESGRLVRGLGNTIYVVTSYPDGQPARTRIAMTGVERELETNALGVATAEITPQEEQISLTVRATDNTGKIGRRELRLECGKAAEDFLIRTDRAVYDGGQTMRLLALGGAVEPVFLDFIKEGQTVLTDVVPMSGGRGEYQFDLPPELFGTIEICAYRYGSEGLPVGKTRVVYVRQAGQLKLETKLDRPEYRPGERAKLAIAVTDPQGKPVPGAVSLAAVDEAVFAVLTQRPGLEQTFFTLEQELLKPVYEIHPWSPDIPAPVQRDEKNVLEQAMFSRTSGEALDRETALKRLLRQRVGDNPRLQRLIDETSVEELSQRVQIPKAIESALDQQRIPYTLGTNSMEAKVWAAQRLRSLRGSQIAQAWLWFALFLLVVFAILVPRVFLYGCLTVVAFVCALLGLLMLVVLLGCSKASEAPSPPDELAMALSLSATKAPDSRLQPGVAAAPPTRVRQWFPETLLWRPEVITDDSGRASVEVDLADSITTWRLSASAVSADGQLGAAQGAIRVFQPFFVDLDLPVSLTRGDEVAVPAVVYNYLDKAQTVELALADGSWFERLDAPTRKLELGAGEVRAVHFRLRAKQVGRHELEVRATAGGVADAVRRQIEVVPDGHKVEQTSSGTLQQPAAIEWVVPQEAIEGSVAATVRIHPSTFSQVVEGLDAIFQRPYGCFEQTSSTTYPNVLALDYLRRNRLTLPAVEAKARQYIHLGYQRLVSFEVAGGGFDWFGRPPANLGLTAYGLMEFRDMARVHDVDPRLIERTRKWLLDQQRPDGTWSLESRRFHGAVADAGSRFAQLATTAYIAWSVFDGHPGDPKAAATLRYLLQHAPNSIDDPYVLALVANALVAIDPRHSALAGYADRLEALKRTSNVGQAFQPDAGRASVRLESLPHDVRLESLTHDVRLESLTYWEQAATGRTMFYGAGRSGSVETTGLACLAMLSTGRYPATVRSTLAWLVAQKDPSGTWHSTQATVLALKALLAGTGKPPAEHRAREIEVRLDGKPVRTLAIPPDQAEVMQQVDLSPLVTRGNHQLAIRDASGLGAGYQAALRFHVPARPETAGKGPLSITMKFDKTTLAVRDRVTVTATVVNHTSEPAPMVILDLPIPAGFSLDGDDFAPGAEAGTIARRQVTARSVIVYLRELAPGKPLELSYVLRATTPVKVAVPPARAYEYYDPDKHTASAPGQLVVTAGGA